MAVTLADVARRAGVSTASASMVLSGRYLGRVSEDRANAIRAAASDLNYVRNDLAQGLRTARSHTIGLITEQVASTPYATTMIATATATARMRNHLLILVETDGNAQTSDDAIRDLTARQVHGLAYAAMYHHQIRLPRNARPDLIILDGYAANPAICAAVPDEVQGAHDAAAHLLSLGHQRLAFINDSLSRDAAPLRLRGVKSALAEAGLALRSNYYAEVETRDVDAVARTASAMLNQAVPPTAMFTYNDATAIIVAQAARHCGLRIPEDLSIVGFDNFTTLIELFAPGLTTVQLPHEEMARWTITHLIDGAAPPCGPSPQPGTARHHFPCPLVIRASTAPPHPS